MLDPLHLLSFGLLLHLLTVIGIGVRVITLRPAPGVGLAWLLVVAFVPAAGAVLYLLFGERRVGRLRARRRAAQNEAILGSAAAVPKTSEAAVDWAKVHPEGAAIDRMVRTVLKSPALGGNGMTLFSDSAKCLQAIAADVDAATTSVFMAFYIWNEGGLADGVLEALVRAAGRGVKCRVLVDALGARPWWKTAQPERLRAAGVQVRPALPTSLLRTLATRTDLRLHRKIVVVDGATAWTGSMNLVDPKFFKADAGVGPWVDAMVRIQGYAVVPLAATVIADWSVETGEPTEPLFADAVLDRVKAGGPAIAQVVPTGPGQSGDLILQVLLSLCYAAREELVLTTPYLIPDDSMFRALRGAAERGVRVELIVPERVDSFLVRHASRSYLVDLLRAGVRVHLFRGGLLHTKSVTVDGKTALFGTVNLDMRSIWLNYEVSLVVHDPGFVGRLRALQATYMADSDPVDLAAWQARPFARRFLEDAARLASPLL